jgi:hypothetical protein
MKTMGQIKQAIRDKYAWPGGYPIFLVMNDGDAVCIDCARKEYRQIAHDTVKEWRTEWDAAGPEINWEDSELTCAHCNDYIESAYADPPVAIPHFTK